MNTVKFSRDILQSKFEASHWGKEFVSKPDILCFIIVISTMHPGGDDPLTLRVHHKYGKDTRMDAAVEIYGNPRNQWDKMTPDVNDRRMRSTDQSLRILRSAPRWEELRGYFKCT